MRLPWSVADDPSPRFRALESEASPGSKGGQNPTTIHGQDVARRRPKTAGQSPRHPILDPAKGGMLLLEYATAIQTLEGVRAGGNVEQKPIAESGPIAQCVAAPSAYLSESAASRNSDCTQQLPARSHTTLELLQPRLSASFMRAGVIGSWSSLAPDAS